MEHQTESLINYVPSFVRSCNLLLIHDNTFSLIYLSSLLEQYSFKVTAIDNTSAATSMIYNDEGRFKLIMAKANMRGNIDALAFQKDIPVILILSGELEDVTGKALAKGSCYFLQEPIGLDDLKSLWQHLHHPKAYSPQYADSQGQVNGANGKRKHGGDNEIVEFNENERLWTPELHQKFQEAVRVLGGNNDARPRRILSRMNEPYLTVRQVASHLQKYKIRLKFKENANNDLPPARTSSNSHNKAQLTPSPSEGSSSSGTKYDFSAPSTCLNRSQNQMNYSGTQHYLVPEILKQLETPPHNPTFPIDQLTYSGSQSLEYSTVEHHVPADSLGQDQPETEFDYLFKMLVEDCDHFELFGDGTNLDELVGQYSEMLKTILDGGNPNMS